MSGRDPAAARPRRDFVESPVAQLSRGLLDARAGAISLAAAGRIDIDSHDLALEPECGGLRFDALAITLGCNASQAVVHVAHDECDVPLGRDGCQQVQQHSRVEPARNRDDNRFARHSERVEGGQHTLFDGQHGAGMVQPLARASGMARCRWYSLRAVSIREPSTDEPLRPPSAASATRAVEHNPANWIRSWAERHGERTAIVFDERESSWTAFENRVAQLAGALRSLGVAPGDRVAIHLANHPAYLDTVFACARIGAISLPINLRLAPAELAFILGDARPVLVIRDPEHEAVLTAAGERLGKTPAAWCVPDTLDEWAAELAAKAGSSVDDLPDIAPVEPDDPMMIMYSSGTTGTPKGAVLPHRKALFNALNASGCFAIDPTARCLVFAPLFHSLGLHILSLPLLFGGGTLVLHRRFHAQAVLADIGRQEITYMGGVPTHYERLLEALAEPAASFDLSSLGFLFGAGAAIEPATVHAFAAHDVVLKQGYGQTETSMLCCLDEADAVRKAGSVGRALEHLTLRVVDRESLAGPVSGWRDVSTDPAAGEVGEVGEIVVRGPITMLGYWRNEEATRETLREGWVLTGDLARIDPEGFVTLTGRSKEMFISGGENVYPAEIEAAYADHPGVREIAVVGIEDPDWGEVGCAFVVREPGRDLSAETLLAWGREVLAPFKLPRDFVFVDALPRTGSGKVQKFKLAASRT